MSDIVSDMDIQTLIDKAGGAQQLADMLGCGRTTVLDWRRTGTIPGHRAQQIAQVLGIPLVEIVPLITPTPKRAGRDMLAYA